MTNFLFRKEVIEAKKSSWMGRPVTYVNFSIKITVFISFILICFIAAFFSFGTYTRRVHASGIISPVLGINSIKTTVRGKILEVYGREGQEIKKGEKIFILDLEINSKNGPTIKQIKNELMEQKKALKIQKETRLKKANIDKESLARKIFYLNEVRKEIGKQILSDNSVIPKIENALRIFSFEREKHLINEMQLQNQIYNYASIVRLHSQMLRDYDLNLNAIEDSISILSNYDNNLVSEIAEFDKKISQINREIAENSAREIVVITAPSDGVLTAVRFNVGDNVEQNDSLASFLPLNNIMEANLYVTSSAIGFLKKGEVVQLRYSAYPYQRFGLYKGIISEITQAPIVNIDGNTQSQNSIYENISENMKKNSSTDVYRIRVRPSLQYVNVYGERKKLSPGMVVDAEIAIDSRKIFEWMFDPIKSAKVDILQTTGQL
ncbi:HlyD family secretion protein [Acetobacter indonesiensis]